MQYIIGMFRGIRVKKGNYMRKIIILVLLFTSNSYCYNFITNATRPGRLGDQILTYIRTKFLARAYNLKFCYKPFLYSDQFVMHRAEYAYNASVQRGGWKKIEFTIDQINNKENYICYADPTANVIKDDLYKFIMRNYTFAKEIRTMVAPNRPITLLKVPKDRITVAVHVRKGSNGDRILSQVTEIKFPLYKYEDYSCPQKFPSDDYFIDQIKILSDLLHDAPLYVYIFTDAVDPQALLKKYKVAINKENIEFECRSNTNNGVSFVLEDFFSMAYQFDCLIRGISCFAYAAQCVGNHKIIIYAKHGVWQEGKGVVIDDVDIIIRNTKNICNTENRLFYDELKENNYQKIQEQLLALWA
jgi:hypothetical protein